MERNWRLRPKNLECHGSPYTTKFLGGLQLNVLLMGPSTVLSKVEEEILVKWILALADRHFPIIKDFRLARLP